jgi:predicted homoserine dehydrogenase-like protein
LRPSHHIGIVGTGFIARGLLYALEGHRQFRPGAVLTRRKLGTCREFPRPELLTHSVERLLRRSDLIVECSGDPLHAAEVIDAAVGRGIPVVTSNVEFHVTLGSCFAGRGYVTEAEGDQPGVLAAMRSELLEMGFTPTAYGNLKRFYDPNPTRASMAAWGARHGIRLRSVTAFTDGTKLQMEMALVGNAFGAVPEESGMRGREAADIESFAAEMSKASQRLGRPIIDYAVSPTFPAGVVITATADDPRQTPYLEYLKLGAGPGYTFVRPYHLCHLEMLKTIRRTLAGEPPLLTNGASAKLSVAAVAKRALNLGERIDQGVGSFEVRGICLLPGDAPGHVPIGLLTGATVMTPIAAGEIVRFSQVQLPDSFGLRLWRSRNPGAEDTGIGGGRPFRVAGVGEGE